MKGMMLYLLGNLALNTAISPTVSPTVSKSLTTLDVQPIVSTKEISTTKLGLEDIVTREIAQVTLEPKLNFSPIEDLTIFPIPPLIPFGFSEGSACATPASITGIDIDIHRTLFVHDEETLSAADFSLRRTLQKIADDVSSSVPSASPELVFKQFWDTQNDSPNAETLGNPHCDDSIGSINGYPLNQCERAEGNEASGGLADLADKIDNEYQPVALVNRIDLADKGWRTCGEHRIIYAHEDGIEKNLIIFEAVLPNPKPGCRSGCRDVVEFWLDLSNDIDPNSRATKLSNFFYNGLPGFAEVVHTNHYASSVNAIYGNSNSGQIRTNQFLAENPGDFPDPWTLKEFRTFLSCAGGSCDFDIMPTSVKGNPYGQLWSRDIANGIIPSLPPANPYAVLIPGIAAKATSFQANLLSQVDVPGLATPGINEFSLAVAPIHNAAESQSLSPVFDHYRNEMNGSGDNTFVMDLNTAGIPFGLNANHLANRATALSCAGCHQPTTFGLTSPNALGGGFSWPNSLGFVHVDTGASSLLGEPEFNPFNFNGNADGFNLSEALLDEFLPHREDIFEDLANEDVCNCVPNFPIVTPIDPGIFEKLVLIERELPPDPVGPVIIENELLKTNKLSSPVFDKVLAPVVRDVAEVKAVEQKQTELLLSEGIRLPSVKPKAESITLDKAQLRVESLEQVKRETFDALVVKEPPRETITGSFRTH